MSVAIEKTSSPSDIDAEKEHRLLHSLARFVARGWVRTLLVSMALFALLLIPRLADLDALVTPDEPLWIARSANFYEALTKGDLRDTYQYVHPGVPVMWLGALGYFIHISDMPDLMGRSLPVRNRAVQDVLEKNGYSILDVLVELRQVVIVASSLVAIGLFLCLKKLVDFWAAAATIAFLALDPMHIGFTRLLHLDGISANLVMLAVVAFSWYLKSKSRSALIVAGLVTGIACLTRTANAILGPFFALMSFTDIAIAWRSDRSSVRLLVRRYADALIGIGLIAFVVFFALWPAMWVAPIDTLRTLWTGSRDLSESGTELDSYFLGNVTSDPGWRYYPVVLSHRLGAFTVFGMLIALAAAIRPHDLGERFNRRLAGHLVAFAAIYVVILSTSPKKYDRYALPSVVALDLVAGLAWVAAAVWIGRKLIRTSAVAARWTAVVLVIVVLLGQTDYALRMRPIYIDAASPLTGGIAGAQDDYSFNWGISGKEIAEALEKIPSVENSRVVVGGLPATTDYFLPFRVNAPEYGSNLRTARVWMNTDFVVLTFPEIQSELYPLSLLAWFELQLPIATITTDHGVYARIYDVRNANPPDSFYGAIPKAIWDGNATVLAADYPDSETVGDDSIAVSLYVQTDQPSRQVRVTAEVVSNDGVVIGTVTTDTAITPGEDGIAKVSFEIPIQTDIDPQRYRIRYGFADVATGLPLPAINGINGEAIDELVTIGTVLVRPARAPGTTN